MQATEPLLRKLRLNTPIDADNVTAIERLPITVKDIPAHSIIAREGERPVQCCLLVDGIVCRSKTTDAGKRQILSIHIAGEAIPDLQSLHLHVMDHDMTTLSRSTVGCIPHDALHALTRERPLIGEALWRETLIDAAMFREWIVNVGRRSAIRRLAHLLAEIGRRMQAIGTRRGRQV